MKWESEITVVKKLFVDDIREYNVSNGWLKSICVYNGRLWMKRKKREQ